MTLLVLAGLVLTHWLKVRDDSYTLDKERPVWSYGEEK
jgi:hypothetical protein